jgi:hypothetical protein
MSRKPVAATFAFSLFALPTILAQSQTQAQSPDSINHVIKVRREGTVLAEPDLDFSPARADLKVVAIGNRISQVRHWASHLTSPAAPGREAN